MKHLNTILISLAFLGLSMSSIWAQSTYIITGSGTQFSAFKDGAVVPGANDKPIQTVINAIKVDAARADCTIQFGTGTSTLDIGASMIDFDGGFATGKDWGLVTLTGKLTTACSGGKGAIYLLFGASIDSKADITNTIASGTTNATFRNDSYGRLTISGGTVSLTNASGMAIYNTSNGEVHITGGVVEAKGENGIAVYSTSKGEVTVSGDAVITSSNTNGLNSPYPGTILIVNSDDVSGTCLEITGGRIENVSSTGVVIYNNSPGTINISGGDVTSTGDVIANGSTGDINISGTAQVSTTTTGAESAIINRSSGAINVSSGTVSAESGYAIYSANASTGDINITGGTLTTKTGTAVRINNAKLSITGGTVQGTEAGGMAIFISNAGEVNISGTTHISTTTGIAIDGGSFGKITVSDSAQITSENVDGTFPGTIYLHNNDDVTAERLVITGGTIENTADIGDAICNKSKGIITISGGTVSATDGYAVISQGTVNISDGIVSATTGIAVLRSNGTVTISGGTVSATTGWAIYNGGITITGGIVFAYGTTNEDVIFGNYTQSGNAVIVAWNEEAGTTTYEFNTDDDIFVFPATATAVWTKQGDDSGIAVANEENIGFIPLPVTITGVNIVETRLIASVQVYPNPTKGEFWVSGFEVSGFELQVTGIEIFDVMGRTVGANLRVCPESNAINISHLPNGVYFLKITTENGVITKKIIKN